MPEKAVDTRKFVCISLTPSLLGMNCNSCIIIE